MPSAIVSQEYEVKIPESIRERLKIEPGQKVEFIVYRGVMRVIPVVPIESERGSLEGIDTHIEREPDRF